MGVTEIAFLPLKVEGIPEDFSSSIARTHTEALEILLSQPGVQRAYWGCQVENKQLLMWFVDWDDIESHKNFTRAKAFDPLLDKLDSLLAGAPTAYHVHFDPHPPKTAVSGGSFPTTEIVTMWFPVTYTQEDQEQIVKNERTFVAVLKKEAPGYRYSTGGWVAEEVEVPHTMEKARAYVMLVSWTSLEAHMKFRETCAFKGNIHHILDGKDLKHIEAVHANLI